MRFLFFVSKFHPHIGGMENYVLELGRALLKLGHGVSVVTCNVGNEKVVDRVCGLRVFRLPCVSFLGGTLDVPLFRGVDIDFGGFDVFVSNTRFFPITLFCMFFAKRFGKRWVHVEHGCEPYRNRSKFLQFGVRLYDLGVGRLVMMCADLVAGVSSKHLGFVRGMGARRVVLVRNGVDTGFWKPKLYKSLVFRSKTVLCVGRLVWKKGVQDLILACKDMYKVDLFIVGGGNYRKALEELNLRGCVRFLGEKSKEEVRSLLGVSDVLVCPSYSEGLPSVVLEALSMNVPVVVSDVGSLRDVVKSGVNGYFFKAGDVVGLRKMLKRALKRKSWGNLRKPIVDGYDWKASAKSFVEALEV